jgi:hypothetical protein
MFNRRVNIYYNDFVKATCLNVKSTFHIATGLPGNLKLCQRPANCFE